MKTLKQLLFLLSSQERRYASAILVMVFIMAILDMIGVASILPFVAVLSNPEIIETNNILNTAFQLSRVFGVENNQQFLFALGILVFFLLIISLVFKAGTTYLQTHFILMRECSIGRRLIEGYLHQPYSWFLNRHSADLGKNILSEVQQVVGSGIRPLMELIAQAMVSIVIIILLVVVDPKLTIIVGLSLSLAYLVIFYFVRKYLDQLGNKRLLNNKLRFSVVSEAFGAAKEVKVGGLEKGYINLFSNFAKIFARTQASALVVANFHVIY